MKYVLKMRVKSRVLYLVGKEIYFISLYITESEYCRRVAQNNFEESKMMTMRTVGAHP